MKKKSQFILQKIPPHVVRLLGKIHALSIEVLPRLAEKSIINELYEMLYDYVTVGRYGTFIPYTYSNAGMFSLYNFMLNFVNDV